MLGTCQSSSVIRRGRRLLSLFLLAVFLPLMIPPDAWGMLTQPVYTPLLEPRTTYSAPLCTKNPYICGFQYEFLSHQDLIIPVSGLPISVIRTYNSLNTTQGADFGYGWTYAIADIRMEIDEERGIAFEEDGVTPFDIHTGGGRDVTITMPDGTRTTFTYSMEKASYGYRAKWTASPGTYATLEPTCDNYLTTLPFMEPYWNAAGDATPWENFDFPGFILTMKDGTKYSIERENTGGHFDENGSFYQTYGQGHLKRIEDRAGNQISISSDNIIHTNALGEETKRVVFERDPANNNRIVAIHDPAGLDANGDPTGPAQVTYEYDGSGNLWKVNKLVDPRLVVPPLGGPGTPVYQTIEYVYTNPAFPHFITEVKDPRGITPLKTEYDSNGRIVATIDAYGNKIELSHDLNGRTETIFDRDGNPTIHAYDARGNVTETIDAQGNITRRTYDALNNETSTTDALGNTTNCTFDGSGNRTSVTDPLGNTTNYTYDGYGNQTSVTDPLGNVTTNAYDGSGNLISTTNALGQTTRNTYVNGNLTETRDALGNVTATFGYDGSGNMTSTTDPNGVVRSFGYDANGNQTGTSFQWVNPDNAADIRNVITQTIYNAAGQVTETVDPEGNHSSTEYNELGKPWKTTDKLGNVTQTTYDARGNVIETVYSDGTITRTVYDVNGRTLATVDRHVPGTAANGSRTIYDSIGRVVRSERLANVVIDIVAAGVPACPSSVFVSAASVISSTASRYDGAGRVLESTNVDNETTRYEYDAAGRQAAVIDALGNRTEYEYDVAGRQTLVRDALGRETTFQYDSLGRRVSTVFADGTTTLTQYDQLGRRIAETDQAGVTRNFEYDTQGRLIAVLLPAVPDPENAGALTRPHYQYFYDIYGRLETIRDPKGRETQFTYDQFGRQLTRALPMGQTESQAYNTLGQLASKVDFKTQVTAFVYDTLGRVSQKNLFPSGTQLPPAGAPAETVAFAYDDLGRQDTITDTRGVTEFGYDQDGRVIQVASPEGTINYEYDAVTGRKTRTSTANSDIRYGYDELGRLATVSVHKQQGVVLTQPEVTTYAYTEVGSRESMSLPNGVTTLYEYDNLNRLTNLSHFNSTNQLLAGYAYTLAPTGRRTGVDEQVRRADNTLAATTIRYTFDQLNRLTQEASTSDLPEANFTTTYSYDLVGNRLAKATTRNQDGVAESITYASNSNDQLITETSSTKGVTTYTFDPNGSLISKTNGTTGESVTYSYNLENRLIAADIARVEKDSQGQSHNVAISSSYQYDQSGIRTRAQSTTTIAGQAPYNTTRIFLNDGANLTGYSQVLEELPVLGVTPTVSYVIGDDEISQASPTGTRWFLRDGHGSTRLLTASSGGITDRFSFDAWGNMLGGNPSVTNPVETTRLFGGEEYCGDLQWNYHRARYYDMAAGVWNQMDPVEGDQEAPQSLHKYSYCAADAVNGSDPDGEKFVPDPDSCSKFTEFKQATDDALKDIRTYLMKPPPDDVIFPYTPPFDLQAARDAFKAIDEDASYVVRIKRIGVKAMPKYFPGDNPSSKWDKSRRITWNPDRNSLGLMNEVGRFVDVDYFPFTILAHEIQHAIDHKSQPWATYQEWETSSSIEKVPDAFVWKNRLEYRAVHFANLVSVGFWGKDYKANLRESYLYRTIEEGRQAQYLKRAPSRTNASQLFESSVAAAGLIP